MIIGRLTADPELKTTSTGKQVASFTVAVDNQGKDAGATFFRCQAWEKQAGFVNDYLAKGRLVSVSGRIQSRKYTDKDGNNREAWEVTAERVQGLDRPKEDDRGNPTSTAGSARQTTTGATSPDEYDPFADE